MDALALTTVGGRPAVALGSDEGLLVHDVASGELLSTVEFERGCPAVVASASDDVPVLVRCEPHADLEVRETRDGALRLTLPRSRGAYAPGRLLTTVLRGVPVVAGLIEGLEGPVVRVWELTDGVELPERLVHPAARVMASVVALDLPILAVGGEDGRVRTTYLHRHDYLHGRRIGEGVMLHPGGVSALDCVVEAGTPLAVTGGPDGKLQVFDLVPGALVGAVIAAHDAEVVAVACTSVDGRPTAVSTGRDGRLVVSDLLGQTVVGHAAAVEIAALACGDLDGRSIAVTAEHTEESGVVRVWDLGSA